MAGPPAEEAPDAHWVLLALSAPAGQSGVRCRAEGHTQLAGSGRAARCVWEVCDHGSVTVTAPDGVVVLAAPAGRLRALRVAEHPTPSLGAVFAPAEDPCGALLLAVVHFAPGADGSAAQQRLAALLYFLSRYPEAGAAGRHPGLATLPLAAPALPDPAALAAAVGCGAGGGGEAPRAEAPCAEPAPFAPLASGDGDLLCLAQDRRAAAALRAFGADRVCFSDEVSWALRGEPQAEGAPAAAEGAVCVTPVALAVLLPRPGCAVALHCPLRALLGVVLQEDPRVLRVDLTPDCQLELQCGSARRAALLLGSAAAAHRQLTLEPLPTARAPPAAEPPPPVCTLRIDPPCSDDEDADGDIGPSGDYAPRPRVTRDVERGAPLPAAQRLSHRVPLFIEEQLLADLGRAEAAAAAAEEEAAALSARAAQAAARQRQLLLELSEWQAAAEIAERRLQSAALPAAALCRRECGARAVLAARRAEEAEAAAGQLGAAAGAAGLQALQERAAGLAVCVEAARSPQGRRRGAPCPPAAAAFAGTGVAVHPLSCPLDELWGEGPAGPPPQRPPQRRAAAPRAAAPAAQPRGGPGGPLAALQRAEAQRRATAARHRRALQGSPQPGSCALFEAAVAEAASPPPPPGAAAARYEAALVEAARRDPFVP
eukprot:TRINITY_DN22985_c0_g1_i1.p1 TRINITY_DN22985_c0_g1~~TRINITY_DN22985_c0_g1_i1.p1  ORF type:complete len:679 (+),score=221.74 TRINITY_DN22985_c0_g1_i1:72-2039(+)